MARLPEAPHDRGGQGQPPEFLSPPTSRIFVGEVEGEERRAEQDRDGGERDAFALSSDASAERKSATASPPKPSAMNGSGGA